MLKHLTVPRSASVQSFFQTTSDEDLFGCYAWNQAVGAGFLPILADFEIPLRNALHRALSRHYGGVESFTWMMPRPNPVHLRNALAPAVLPPIHKMSPKSLADISAVQGKIGGKKGAGYSVTPDDIVAALPFGFWEVLIGGLSHQAHPTGLQSAILTSVFPRPPAALVGGQGTPAFRELVIKLLRRIREVRNRIGRHDSLWTTPEFNHQGIVGLVPRRPRHTVNSLRLFSDNVCWLAGWIDPDIPSYICGSDHWWSLQALLSRQALGIYRQTGGRIGTYRAILAATDLPALKQRRRATSQPLFLQRLRMARHFY